MYVGAVPTPETAVGLQLCYNLAEGSSAAHL